MTSNQWIGTVNVVLYGLLFTKELGEEPIARTARRIVIGSISGKGPEVYCRAIEHALRVDAWPTNVIDTSHSEADLRDFLRRLLARLDELRPWPEPPYVQVRSADCTFDRTRPVASIAGTISGPRTCSH